MTGSRLAALRRFWLNVHLWLGVGLAVLIVPLALSGAVLVWHDELDRLVAPARYAVTGDAVAQKPSVYIANAMQAGEGGVVSTLRWPERPGWPVTVSLRKSAEGGPLQLLNVTLDPPSGRVLGVSDFRSSWIGIAHVLHGNLMVPQWSGRQIVGWVGVAMLILSLTGIWLWWPRNGAFLRGLSWRRAPKTSSNLHHLFGFWLSLPLAFVSLTGIYLSFPQQGRALLSSVAEMGPPGQRPGGGQPMRGTKLDPDAAVQAAQALLPSAAPVMLAPPSQMARAWRVQMNVANEPARTVMVDDATGVARLQTVERKGGDSIAQWIRWLHEGSHSGFVWAFIVFLTGIAPPLFAITGIMMWLRKRAGQRRVAALRPAAQGKVLSAQK